MSLLNVLWENITIYLYTFDPCSTVVPFDIHIDFSISNIAVRERTNNEKTWHNQDDQKMSERLINVMSPDLKVHDDLPFVHVLRVNFDPVNPERLWQRWAQMPRQGCWHFFNRMHSSIEPWQHELFPSDSWSAFPKGLNFLRHRISSNSWCNMKLFNGSSKELSSIKYARWSYTKIT